MNNKRKMKKKKVLLQEPDLGDVSVFEPMVIC
jgi:hypothetical protein